MTTNRDWLFSLPLEEQYAWMNAEHAESPTSDVMRNIGQVIEETVKRGVYGDTEPHDADSREQLEAEIRYEYNGAISTEADEIIAWLDRQAAITEREYGERMASEAMCSNVCAVVCEQRGRIAELQAKVDELQELNEYHALQYELASEDADRLQAQVDRLKAERERYRSKFGKCIDYADAIHALMDDEGMA